MVINKYFPGIIGYSNILNNSIDYIDNIENDIANNVYGWSKMLTGSELSKPEFYEEKRRGMNIGLSICATLSKNANDFQTKLTEATNIALSDYSSKYGYWGLVGEGWVLLKYEKDDFFVTHTDSSRSYPRQVSTVYYVNDNYSGGELTFPYIDLTIKPMAGELIVFPSTNMFSHQAEKIIEGTKYSLANWFN